MVEHHIRHDEFTEIDTHHQHLHIFPRISFTLPSLCKWSLTFEHDVEGY